MTKILLVEDDKAISATLSRFLFDEGFEVNCAYTKAQAFEKLGKDFDLALVDITLPDGSGYEVCKAIKTKGDIPVIFLTARTDEFSAVTGLDIGGDDYIEKPYRPRELVSRIKSVLRRCGKSQTKFVIGSVCVDTEKGIVTKNGTDVCLSALEYRILLIFINNPSVVITRSRLLSEIWDMSGEFVDDNTLSVYINRIRKKIEDDPENPKIIITVRGTGYRLGDHYASK